MPLTTPTNPGQATDANGILTLSRTKKTSYFWSKISFTSKSKERAKSGSPPVATEGLSVKVVHPISGDCSNDSEMS
jgi:hypothetical protein